MKQIVYLSLIIVTFISLSACRQEKNNVDTVKLVQLDSLLCVQPEVVNDSLKQIDHLQLSTYNKAYYQLLEIIAKDKTSFDFSSDSIINSTVDDLSHYHYKHPQNYARSLMYQGIVRYRMQITDSTAYQPLKQAITLFQHLNHPELKNQYLCFYYLGEIHDKNNNVYQAKHYFIKAAQVAQQLNDTSLLFLAYRNLFWNSMKKVDYFQAKLFIDSLNLIETVTDYQNREKDNIYSSYYKSQHQYLNAIRIDKKLLSYDMDINDSTSIVADCYRLSQNYKEINQLNSALTYGKMSLRFIKATISHIDYFYYLNLAEITEQLSDWQSSAEAYKHACKLINSNIDQSLDTKILELEKRYDFAEAENKRLLAENRSYLFLGLIVVLLLFIIIGLLFYRQYRLKITIAKQKQDELLNNQQQLLEKDAIEKLWIAKLYNYLLQQKNEVGELLYKLQNNVVIKNDNYVSQLIAEAGKSYASDIKKISSELLDDEILLRFIKFSEEDLMKLNESDKFLLMLIMCGLSKKEIATILDVTYDSIRIRKKRLLIKIVNNNINIPTYIHAEIVK